MSISISGQNDRWAQLNAYQAAPTPLSSQNGPWNTAAGATAAPGAAPAGSSASTSAGGTTGALTDSTAKALLAFGGWASGLTISSQTYGQTTATANPPTSSSPSAGQTAITPTGTAAASDLIADLQSMLATLTATPSSGAGGTATTSTPATTPTSDAPANTGTVASASLGTSLLAELQTLGTDLASLSSASRDGRHDAIGGPPRTPPWGNDIANSGSVSVPGSTASSETTTSSITNTGSVSNTGTAAGASTGYSDGLQQQFALSAYLANTASGLDSAASSSMTNINV